MDCTCTCAVLFFCYLSTTVTQLLFDFIKHAVAHFDPFLVPFLLVSAILCFQDTQICLFFPYKKNIWRCMEKKHKNRPKNFCPSVPIMHGIDSYLARSKYYLTIKNIVCTHFYGSPDFGGLAARLYRDQAKLCTQVGSRRTRQRLTFCIFF